MVIVTHEEQMGLNSPAEAHVDYSRTQKCRHIILVVEDDMPTLRLERVILEEAGYLVEGVESGEAALEFITEEPPALVILDVGLPGIDGFTTCRRIRESFQVPVVMVTGNKTAADKKQGKASGADGYVTKPFLTDKLVDLVGEIISESTDDSWEGEGTQPIHTPLPDPQPANAPAPSTSVLDVGDPIGASAALLAEDEAHPDRDLPDRDLPDGDQPIDSAPVWQSEGSFVLVDEEEPEDDPTEVAVVWDSQYSQDQQSPSADPDSEDSLPWYRSEPEYPSPQVNQPSPASSAVFGQGESSAASSPAEQPAGAADISDDDCAISPPALPAGSLAETAHEELAPVDDPADKLDDDQYEGTVRLMVTSSGPVKNLLNFVGELRQNNQLRLLRLVASQRRESMDIWLGLREPLRLITLLGDIAGVSQVAACPDQGGDEEEPCLTVAVGP